MTGPHFRPELGAMGVHPRSRKPSPAANIQPRTAFERSPREKTTAPKPHFVTRPWFTWISGAFAAALGFAVVLWLTGPVAAPPAVAILASATVSDATALMAAVQTAGLRGAPDVKGAIEGLKRIDNERVTIKGWAVDQNRLKSSADDHRIRRRTSCTDDGNQRAAQGRRPNVRPIGRSGAKCFVRDDLHMPSRPKSGRRRGHG